MSMHRHSTSLSHDESPSKRVAPIGKDEAVEAHVSDPLRCGVLLVGNASGSAMLKDIMREGVSFTHYIQSNLTKAGTETSAASRMSVTGTHVTPGLVEVAGVSVIEYWNRGCASADRIWPQHDVFLATNSLNHEEYVSWTLGNIAAGETHYVPVKNIVRLPDTCADDTIATAAAFVETTGWKQHLLVVDLEHVCSSEYSFQKFVEHATVRMRDCVALIETASSSVNTTSTVDTFVSVDGIKENPRVVSVADVDKERFIVDENAWPIKGVCAAVMYIHKSTLPMLKYDGGSADKSGSSSIARFMTYLLGEGRPVYGLPIDVVVPLRGVDELRYSTALFDHIQRTKFKMRTANKAQDTDSEIENIFMSNPAEYSVTMNKAKAKRSTLDVLNAKRDFDSRYAAMLRERQLGMMSGGYGKDDGLPERFANVSLRKHDPRIQHPVYQTTNNNYGLKPVSQQQTTLKYYGTRGTFTNDFSAMMYKNTGFNTTRTTSKVHRQMDDF